MTHVFVAPHPDDVALSCGGLIASLRELGQNVAIVTVFSGSGATDGLSQYQREALGFGSKALWPVTEAFNRANLAADHPTDDDAEPAWAAQPDRLDATQADADAAAKRFWQRSSWYRRASIHNVPLAGQVLVDDVSTQGVVLTTEITDAAAANEAMATRRLEDERFAYFAEASVVLLDLPDAVFRGYEGDDQLLGAPRPDDSAPFEILRREIARLEPQKVYFPLGIGGHVDHRLVRNAGLALLAEPRGWVMPGPDWAGMVSFYEDFPYAWWTGFSQLADLGEDVFDRLPAGVTVVPEFADVSDQLERTVSGITLYQSQMDRLFGGTKPMADAVRAFHRRVADLGGVPGFAERYWASTRL
jgi:LmbE family N-acetylglucosaminyl deacetylase